MDLRRYYIGVNRKQRKRKGEMNMSTAAVSGREYAKRSERVSLKERMRKYFEENAAVLTSGLIMLSGGGNTYNLYRMMK